VTTTAGAGGPAQTAYPPPAGKGPIDSMRAMERGARERAAQFQLVVYPLAEHGFNLQGSSFDRGDDEADAWKRTVEMLRQHHPLR